MPSAARYPVWSLLRDARQRAGLTQRELAARAGTSQSALARYERARTMPDLATLLRLVEACGLDLRMRLEERDSHDDELLAARLAMTPTERAAVNRRTVAAAARSAAAHRSGRVHRLIHDDA